MKMLQKAGIILTVAAASFLPLKAQLPNKLLDKAVVDSTYSMKAEGSKFRLKIEQVQGPGTLIDSMEYTVPIKVDVDKKNIIDLGLGQGQMEVKNFDPLGKQIELKALNPDALIKDVLLRNNQRLVYTIDTTKPPQVGDDIWDVTLGIPDHPQSDGSYYPVQVHLYYSHLAYATKNNMMLDSLMLPLDQKYANFSAQKQVHFLFQSLPATPYPGVDMPEHVKMTTDATFMAIKAKSGLCAGHPEEDVYPTTVLISHYVDPNNPHAPYQFMCQNANPQCNFSNPSMQFYLSYESTYVRADTDTSAEWLGANGAATYPYKDDPNKRGPPAFVLNQDSAHYICFGFKPYADSTDLNHIFYSFYPLIYLKDTEQGREVARSTSELHYNYAVVKIEAPDRLTYTLNSGDLIGTWHQKDTIVPTGVNEPQVRMQEAMNIFPNPAAHEATIQTSHSNESRTFYVFDAMGRIVSEFGINAGEEQHRLNIEAFPAGIYFITGKRNGEKTTALVVE